jgi:hypothetical protein
MTRERLARQQIDALLVAAVWAVQDDGSWFTELYNVQLMQNKRFDCACKVSVCAIQRMYSMLRSANLARAQRRRQSILQTGFSASGPH